MDMDNSQDAVLHLCYSRVTYLHTGRANPKTRFIVDPCEKLINIPKTSRTKNLRCCYLLYKEYLLIDVNALPSSKFVFKGSKQSPWIWNIKCERLGFFGIFIFFLSRRNVNNMISYRQRSTWRAAVQRRFFETPSRLTDVIVSFELNAHCCIVVARVTVEDWLAGEELSGGLYRSSLLRLPVTHVGFLFPPILLVLRGGGFLWNPTTHRAETCAASRAIPITRRLRFYRIIHATIPVRSSHAARSLTTSCSTIRLQLTRHAHEFFVFYLSIH